MLHLFSHRHGGGTELGSGPIEALPPIVSKDRRIASNIK